MRPRSAQGEFAGSPWRSGGYPQGSKNVILQCKINDFNENDAEAKNVAFSYFCASGSLPGAPLGRKSAPSDFTKSAPGRASGATGPQNRSFYVVFLRFFTDSSKIDEISEKMKTVEIFMNFFSNAL